MTSRFITCYHVTMTTRRHSQITYKPV